VEVTIMKKGIIAVSAFLLMVFAVAVFTVTAAEEKKMSKKADKLMSKALKAINEKKSDQAIDLLRQVIVLEPENAMVRHNLGVLLHEKGQVDEAIASFEEALRLQADYQHAQLALRQALFETGKSASTRQDFEKANSYLLKLDGLPRPEAESKNLQAMAQYLLGYNYFNLKQYPQAQGCFEKCRGIEGLEKENPELYANATYFLGMTGHIQGRYEDSCNEFKKYLAMHATSEKKPEFFAHANFFIGASLFRILEAKLAKGEVSGMEKAASEILPYLNTAVENNIPSEDAHVMLGNCYVYMKDYEKAVRTYQRLIELFPQSTQLKSYQDFLGELQKMLRPEQKGKK
jgi:tetratricopeptide (TPR) repeat protein